MRKFAFAGVGVAVGFAGALALLPAAQGATNVLSAYRQLDLFGDAFERVRANYVREVEDSELINAAINGMPLNDAVEKMRGPENSKVTLTVLRQGEKKPLEVTLTRAVIRVESVKYEKKGDIGYIRISSFSEKTDAGVKKAIADLKKQMGGGIRGYVIDLRNDPGGLLDQ